MEAKSKRDPTYKGAFDHHLANQKLDAHASKARSERKRKDVKNAVGKNARAVNRAVNGPFAGPVVATVAIAGAGYAKTKGYDRVAMNAGRNFINNLMKR